MKKKINKSDISLEVETLKVFPNPAKDEATIEFKAAPGNYKIVMTDINGQNVFTKELNEYDGENPKA